MFEMMLKSTLYRLAFYVYTLPAIVLWGITLIGITVMTVRELWLGRSKKRKKRRRMVRP